MSSEKLLNKNFASILKAFNQLKINLIKITDFKINLDLSSVREYFIAQKGIDEEKER